MDRRKILSHCRFATLISVVSLTALPHVNGQENAGAAGFADLQDQLLRHAQCMRDNGYPEYADPSPDGRIRINVDPESAPRFRAASEACRDQLPDALNAFAQPQDSADIIESLVKFASCMRENGIEDFPDPTSEGAFNLAGVSFEMNSARSRTAMETCREQMGGPVFIRMTR